MMEGPGSRERSRLSLTRLKSAARLLGARPIVMDGNGALAGPRPGSRVE